MAARRLIIVLVVLFVASIIAAAIAPERRTSLVGDTSTTSTTTTTTSSETTDATSTAKPGSPDQAKAGRISIRLDASLHKPPSGRAQVGDQVELTIRSDTFMQLEIPTFGVTGNTSPNAPARFSLILRDEGEIPILAARDGRTVANLIVAPASREKTGNDDERPAPSAKAGTRR